MADSERCYTGRDRTEAEIREELTRLEVQLARLRAKSPRHPCDRGETAYQIRRITAQIETLNQELRHG